MSANAVTREELEETMRKAREALKARSNPDPNAGGGADYHDSSSALTLGEDLANRNRTVARPVNVLNAKDNLKEFLSFYYKTIQRFILDQTKFELDLPNLSGNDRRVLHFLANSCNLSHESRGQGENRSFFLRKDTTFYAKQDMYLNVDLEDIAKNVEKKTSKYELRFTRRKDITDLEPGAIGSFEDENAVESHLRFKRATNQYRHAIDRGMSNEEMMDEELSGQRLEDILSAPAEIEAPRNLRSIEMRKTNPVEEQQQNNSTNTRRNIFAGKDTFTIPTDAHVSHKSSSPNPNEQKVVKAYNELCRSCGSKVKLEYPVEEWTCCKHCGVCGRETIWHLEEILGGTDKKQTTGTHSKKRQREEKNDGDASADPSNEDDGDENEEAPEAELEEDEPFTLEDIAETMASDDYHLEDIQGVRNFAGYFSPTEVARHLIFICDLHSLLHNKHFNSKSSKGGRSSLRRNEKRSKLNDTQGDNSIYVLLRESSALSKKVTSLLDDVLSCAFTLNTASADTDSMMGIDKELPIEKAAELTTVACVTGSSVYKQEAKLLVRLDATMKTAGNSSGGEICLNHEALADLEKKYGTKHVFLTKTLLDAIEKA